MHWSRPVCLNAAATANIRRAMTTWPTARGRDFRPVLFSLMVWGNKHFAPEGPSVILVNRKIGAAVDPILTDPPTV